jgi:hypothetical protein
MEFAGQLTGLKAIHDSIIINVRQEPMWENRKEDVEKDK